MSSAYFARGQRACMVCAIVQTNKQFSTTGCPNCEEILQLSQSSEAIQECTSTVFESLITLSEPEKSWVAKWLRLQDYVPGVYAMKVTGTLPTDIVELLRENGIAYVRRDGSDPDADGGGEEGDGEAYE